MRVLIVEDDQTLSNSIESHVTSNGVICSTVGNGVHANRLLMQVARDNCGYDAVILDLTLPGMDGLDVLKSMRRRKDTTPVLILSARVTLADKVNGLEDGADDYLSKPFEPEELLARLRAVARRRVDAREPSMRMGDLEFDAGRGLFSVSGALFILPPKTQAILEELFRRRGHPVSKDFFINIDSEGSSHESVDTQIFRLRKRLRDADAQVSIKTLYGTGYMLEAVADRSTGD